LPRDIVAPLRRAVGEIVALGQNVGVLFLDIGLGGLHARHDRSEGLLDIDRRIAGRPALLLLRIGEGDSAKNAGRRQQRADPLSSQLLHADFPRSRGFQAPPVIRTVYLTRGCTSQPLTLMAHIGDGKS
jgi:hypothetical protein